MMQKIRFYIFKFYKMRYILAVLLCNLSVLTSTRVTYCGTKMCKLTDNHTFCQYSEKVNQQEGIGPDCMGYIEIPLSPDEKLRIVARLNQRRAAAASGRLKGFPTAGNMFKLLWVEELSREAQLWADQCVPPATPEKNDACRDLYSVSVGQCVASVIGEAPGLRPDSMVDLWYMQSIYYKGNVTFYEPPVDRHFDYYGDFAQLVYSKSFMVGCGRSRFMATTHGRMRSIERLVCNFAPRGPTPGRPLWTVAGPATACPPRSQPDEDLSTLCRVQREFDESLDPERIMSPDENMLLDTIFELERNESLNYIGSIDELFLRKVAEAAIGDDANLNTQTVTEQYNTTIFEEWKKSTSEKKRAKLERRRTTADDDWEEETHIIIKTTTVKFDKLNFIGRPKPYLIEELTDEVLDSTLSNRKFDMPDIENKKKKEFQIDYDFTETSEETDETTEASTTEVSTTTTSVTINVNESTSEEFDTVDISTEETANHTEEILELKHMNQDTISTVTFSDSENKTVEAQGDTSVAANDTMLYELMSDPETMAQLQEELERSEREMSGQVPLLDNAEPKFGITITPPDSYGASSKMSHHERMDPKMSREERGGKERADKVRRDLREHPSEEELLAMMASNQEKQHEETNSRNRHTQEDTGNFVQHTSVAPYRMRPPDINDQIPMEDEKKGINKVPMLNMVMRYMPYLRNYQNSFMKRAVSNSNRRMASSFVLVLLFPLVTIL